MPVEGSILGVEKSGHCDSYLPPMRNIPAIG